jgi:hypothetical protein
MAPCGYFDVVQKIVNKQGDANVEGDNGKMSLHLTYGNNHDGVILILCMFFVLFLGFIDHKLYKFV